jgi:CRP-like cAMP-binding protein
MDFGGGELADETDEATARLRGVLRLAFACSEEVASAISRCAVERSFAARAIIVRQGDVGAEVFLLLTGRAQALLSGQDGQLVLLQEYLPGDLFGAVGGLDHQPAEAEVSAAEPSRTAVFRAADFLRLIEMHGALGVAVSGMLMRQLRAARARIAERTILSAAGRVHAELLRLARAGDGVTIRPAPVLAALAVRVHSTRETVSRTIAALERRGLIRREPDALILVAPHRLSELVF